MIPMTLVEVADCVGGRIVVPDPSRVRGVEVTAPASVDSRAVEPGGLFVALQGEHADGHDFAVSAVESGAAAVLCSRPVAAPCVVVDDPVHALGLLARDVLLRLPGLMVVGVTGSQGKTGVKDLLAQVLERMGTTIAPRESFNNEIGVPLTALQADRDTRFLVSELGARGRGHISYLAEIVRPHIGVVLNVGVAHLGEFGSRDEIAVAKGELVESLPADGIAVLNIDDDLVRRMAGRTRARVVWFGTDAGADVRLGPVALDDLGRPRFTLTSASGAATVALRLVGEHQAGNAAAVAAAALAAGVPWPEVTDALSAAVPRSRWRMEITERTDGVTVINDAYNANPDSMRAALDTLATIGAGARTIAVLGEMKELGETAAEAHRSIGAYAAERGIDRIVVVGQAARAIAEGAGESTFVPDNDAALAWLRDQLAPGDVVLVKASNGARLFEVAEALG
jgi:UDP-N-acetylmuramoyl-tripeptide--D-alanyl-D-alanine ligase